MIALRWVWQRTLDFLAGVITLSAVGAIAGILCAFWLIPNWVWFSIGPPLLCMALGASMRRTK